LWPKISILEKVPWTAEKNVYCVVAGWNILDIFHVHLIYGVIQF
jgi:hypothetical protein